MKKEVKWDRTALIVEVCCIVLVGLLDLSLCWMDGMLAYHKVLVVLVNVVGIIIFPWLLLHFCMDTRCRGKKPWQIWNKAGRRSGRIIKDYQICSLLCWFVAWAGSYCPDRNAWDSFPMVEILFFCRVCQSDPDILAHAQADGGKDGRGICCNGTDPGADFLSCRRQGLWVCVGMTKHILYGQSLLSVCLIL